jgi:methylated-DNA-[protein]-cysteine S-methyltransferase
MMSQEIEKHPTPFQKKVYEACSRIPEGKVTTYGRLAASINCGSARAVGQALKVNPFAPDVPCHRVVKSDRGLGGFFGQKEGPEVVRKRQLLEREGVGFENSDKVEASCLWDF